MARVSLPICEEDKITCGSGTPLCTSGSIAVCGSKVGLKGKAAGPGCTDKNVKVFYLEREIFCTPSSNITLDSLNNSPCNKGKLCPAGKRFKVCREDRAQCQCICPFEQRSIKDSPRCKKNDEPICSNKLTPLCSNPNNKPACFEGKLVCQDSEASLIDLSDKVFCRKSK